MRRVEGAARRRNRGLGAVGGWTLLAFALGVAAVPVTLLSYVLLDTARDADTHRLDEASRRLVLQLEEGGLPALRRRLVGLAGGELTGGNAIAVALWRERGETRQLVFETGADFAAAVASLSPGTRSVVAWQGSRWRVDAPDLAAISAGWTTPVADIELRVGVATPGPELGTARQTVAIVWVMFAVTALVGLLLQLNHRLRYETALRAMNERLDDFARGDLKTRLETDLAAPDLAAVARHLNATLGRLEDLIAGLRAVSANMGHEMRKPLQLMRIDLERLRSASPGIDAAAVAAIDRRIDAAVAGCEGVMLLSLLEEERTAPLPRAVVNLSAVVTEALEDVEDALSDHGRRLVQEIAPGVQVRGERRLIDRIVVNLLDNARKHAPPGATIAVKLRREADRFAFAVANSGGGFPTGVRDHAFQRFARGGGSAAEAGVGLGLSLVQAAAARHGFEVAITPSDAVAEVVVSGPAVASAATTSDPSPCPANEAVCCDGD